MKQLYTLTLIFLSFCVTAQMNMLTDGDFEANNDPKVWTGNVEIRDENNNKFFFADVAAAGASFSVNLSQNVAMDEGDTYTLSFEASTGMGNSRTIMAGIGLSVDPYTNVTETITLTSTNETYTFDFVANFQGSATTSRVLFDMGADTGIVVIDNVSLVKKDVPQDVLYYPLYEGTFGGASRQQTFLFPTGAEAWAGFGNSNANIYPLDFPNGGQITFKASADAATSLYFKFEANAHPNVEPSYAGPTQAITTEATIYTIPLTSQGVNTFNSALLYLMDRDVTVNITDIKIEKFDTDGSTVLTTSYPIYDDPFGSATYSHAFTYPTGAEAWAGYSNTNLDVSPVSLENGGKITFKASATADTSLKFRFEANAHPNVDPAYDVTPKAITAAEATYEITLAPQGTNTFNSQLLYLIDRDVTVKISDVVITATAGDPATNASLSDLLVDGATIGGFDTAVKSYTYKVDEGTTTVPQITATTFTSGATTVITQATAIPGDATVVVTATDGSTTDTYTVSFKDVIPSTAAPTPPARNAADVISLYSDAYTDVASNFDAGWCGASSVSEISVAGNATMAYAGNACQGIVLNASVDASTFTNYHVDIFIEAGTDLDGKAFNLKFVGTPTDTVFKEVIHDLNAQQPSVGEWVSLTGTVDLSTMGGFKEFAVTTNLANVVYYDNLYIFKGTPLSIGDIDEFNFVTYPNPVENTLNVSAGVVVDAVSIFDLTGREVMRATPNAAAFSLDVADLNKGLYLVTVKAGEQELTTKLVK